MFHVIDLNTLIFKLPKNRSHHSQHDQMVKCNKQCLRQNTYLHEILLGRAGFHETHNIDWDGNKHKDERAHHEHVVLRSIQAQVLEGLRNMFPQVEMEYWDAKESNEKGYIYS